MSSYKDLLVYQKSFECALKIHKVSLTFPKIEQYAMGDQMRRASKSICANIAEGHGKSSESNADFKRFLTMAIGSSNEILVWLDFCQKLEYINDEQYDDLHDNYDHIVKMLSKLKSKI